MIKAKEAVPDRSGPTVDECRAQVSRIGQSAAFDATNRERKIFAYITEEALAGRGERIKAYSIATEVLGRDSSFDLQNDPIVRVEAGHLRRSLEHYYALAGRSDPVFVEIPKGGYVPLFSWRNIATDISPFPLIPEIERKTVEADGRQGLRWLDFGAGSLTMLACVAALFFIWPQTRNVAPAPEIPRIVVSPFEDLSKSSGSAAVVTGLSHEVVDQLSKFKDVIVQSSEVADGPRARFSLDGSVEISPDAFRLRIRFVNRIDGSVLWAKSYDGAIRASELVKAQTDIAQDVATTLAQSYGVIFQSDLARTVVDPPDDWAAYACTLSYYAYRANVDRKLLPEVRTCLERAVAKFPNYATAWALLAQTYIEDIRFKFPYSPAAAGPQIDRALSAARHAVELDPLNVRGLQAEMFALYFSKQYEAGRSVGDRALALNPNDTELMGEYGYRLALSGDWTQGCPLIAEARERNPGPLGYYETGLALCSYFKSDFPEAAIWIRKTTVPRNPLYHLIAAAIFSEAGSLADTKQELAWLCQNQRPLVERAKQEVSSRLGRPEDAAFVMTSLRKAGWSDNAPARICSN